ncbi:tyrosine-type recombinase/integrase [Stenotrophobium rhamnosiphilum]|uniref:Integrase n=1 Tax=Stenotrophobium rhamnosiphilum TaxID=2029166 RepID=A0A2T5MI33_9GAMM|nr:site-specific integrase [Stenotrophobium rhamnosiphilum]PTU32241.1 integrase [Stenotrophobium rhamnosiphilum]
MPKKAKELSALAVSRIKTDGRYAVGGADGLHLRIAGSSRAWVLRLAVGSRLNSKNKIVVHRRDIGFGSYPEVSLAEAREKARECRKQAKAGIDPLEERKTAKARAKLEAAMTKTFEECASAYISANRSGWKNEKHIQQWENTLATYAYPQIGQLPVAAIDTGLVLSVLQQDVNVDDETAQLWHAKTETASRLRGRIEVILDWAAFRGFREGENPARWKGHLQHELPARAKVRKVEHHPALPYNELGHFMSDLRQREGVSARALEFAILTAARSGEVRGATWSEIDFKTRTWTVPAERMKAGKEHRVPLSDATMKLLKSLPRVAGSDYVFTAPRGGQLSDMALTSVLRRMERTGLTQHGFRSTFRDWAGETTSYPREVCEHALAHRLADGVEAAYQRGDLLAKRARLMSDWALYCNTSRNTHSDNVVPMKRGVTL